MIIHPFAISSWLAAILCWVFAAIVFFASKKGAPARIWSLFSISVGFWGFAAGIASSTYDTNLSMNMWRAGMLSVAWMPSLFLHFTLRYLGISRKKLLMFFYMYTFFFNLVSFSPFFICNVGWSFDTYYHSGRPATPLFTFYAISWCLMILYSHIYYFQALKYATPEKRKQIIYFLIATVLGFTGGSLTWLVNFEVPLYPHANFTIPLYPIIMGYAIVFHKLMDVRLVISKTIFYSLFAFIISAFYVLSVNLIQYIIPFKYKSNIWTYFALVTLVLLALKPLETLFNRALQKRFFKGTIDQIATQKQVLESQLERSERLKSVGILAAGLAHEIRNPVQPLKTFGEHLELKYNDPAFRKKFIQLLEQETNKITKLTSDLLDFSKPKEPNKVKTDLVLLIRGAHALLESDLAKEGVESELELPDTPIFRQIDPDQMKQALINLILNAKDAMKQSDQKILTLSVKAIKNKALISIKDTGCGIPKDKLPHLFDPFYTDKDGGTGLGLAVTNSIVTKNSGFISVESDLGKGAKFYVTFS